MKSKTNPQPRTVSFTFTEDQIAALDFASAHDQRTRANLIGCILRAHLVESPAKIRAVSFEPDASLEFWVSDRIRGRFAPDWTCAPRLVREPNRDVRVGVRLSADVHQAISLLASHADTRPCVVVKTIVRTWLIEIRPARDGYPFPRFDHTLSLSEHVRAAIARAM